MRTIDSSISVLKPSNIAWWHTSWTGRFILAALLIAAAAFVLTPGRTSAQTPTLQMRCEAAAGAANAALVADCVALITAAESLMEETGDPVINWIGVAEGAALPSLANPNNNWDDVTVADVDDDDDTTPAVMRITEVALFGKGLTGEIHADWAKLTALTTLNLSDNGLTGTVPRSVWALLDEKITDSNNLDLDENPGLDPSPPLNLGAVVTKNAGAQVTLSFDNIWYTTEVSAHEYRYSTDGGTSWGPNDAEGSDGWKSEPTGCDTDGTPDLCPKSDEEDPPGRMRQLLRNIALPESATGTYALQVRAIKTVLVDENDTPKIPKSEVSQIDVVGPQTVTAGSMYRLTTDVSYTTPEVEPDTLLGVTTGERVLVFDPAYEAEGIRTVSVTQPVAAITDPDGQAGGRHSFPVEVLPASDAPDLLRPIPNREVVDRRGETSIDLSRYFDGVNLTYEITVDPNPRVAMARIVGDTLYITTVREGRTNIEVTATDRDTKGSVSDEFRVTVVNPNNPPQLIGNIPDLTLYLDDAGTQVDMAQYFRDQDNEFLRLIPQSSNPRVVTATSVGRNVVFSVNGLGEIRMTIIAQDGAGATAFGTFTVTVLDPNDAPVAVGTIPPQTLRLEDPGLALSLGSYFTDADNDPLTYRAVSADKGVVTVEVTEAMVTLTAVAEGGGTVTVTATDPGGKSATQEILVTVLPANRPPEAVGQIPDQTLQYNDEPLGLDVTMYFTDPDGDELSYVGQGTDASVAEVRVHSTGLARVDPISHGEIEVTVTARDPLGASVSQSFMVTVQGNLPPEAVGVIDDQVLLEGGNAVTINVTEYFSDPNGDELTYMGTSANPDAVQAVVIGGSSELVLRPFAPAEEVTITVTAMDPEGESAAQLVTVSVVAAAPPPTATPMPTATPEPTAVPEPTATPAPTATFVPTGGDGGFPVGLIIVLVLVLAGVAAAVFIIQRRR